MRLRLTIERQGLPPVQLLWSASPLSSISNPPPSSASLPLSSSTAAASKSADLTTAQLLDQINTIVPLEADTWGVEDYVLEVSGFECLHFAKIGDILKDDDEVTVRPLQTQEVRFRALGGRVQVSRDGRHLHDGVSWGRPFIKRAARPPVRIAPRRNAHLFWNDDEDDGDEQEQEGESARGSGDDPQTRLMLSDKPSGYDSQGLYTDEQTGQRFFSHRQDGVPSDVHASGEAAPLRVAKRRLESPFRVEGTAKRVRSNTTMPILRNTSHVSQSSSLGGKSVRFDESQHAAATNGELRALTIMQDAVDDLSSEEDDEEFLPEEADDLLTSQSDITSGPESESSESDKENYSPQLSFYEARRRARMSFIPKVDEQSEAISTSGIDNHQALDEVNTIPAEGHQAGHATASTGIDEHTSDTTTSSDEEISGESEAETSSDSSEEDETAVSTSDASEASSGSTDASSSSEASEISHGNTTPAKNISTLHPFGPGKQETRRRNHRKRLSAKLTRLKKQGLLPENADHAALKDFLEMAEGVVIEPSGPESMDFKIRRQRLLDAIAAGGLDIGDPNIHLETPQVTDEKTQTDMTEDEHLKQSKEPLAPALGKESEAKLSTTKRSRIDAGASRRLLLGGLGMRVPSTKTEEEAMRRASQAESKAQVQKHQRRAPPQRELATEPPKSSAPASVDEDWQQHIVLRAVECIDTSVQYSAPPFPFVQRWDPQQAASLWHQNNNRRQKKNKLKRRYDAEIEEHFDASMYDEPRYDEVSSFGISAQVTGDAANFESYEIHDNMTRRHVLPDLSHSVDLIFEHAVPGARIAYKILQVSEETGWTPAVSEFKIATISSKAGETLTLLLDEDFRPSKQIDPETGERAYSKFYVEAMDIDGEDGLVEVDFAELREPKLIESGKDDEAAGTLGGDADTHSGFLVDGGQTAISDGASAAIDRSSSKRGAPENSFGASTHTLEDETSMEDPRPTKQSFTTSSSDNQYEASLLMHEAGFRTSVDPEANKPLDRRGLEPDTGSAPESSVPILVINAKNEAAHAHNRDPARMPQGNATKAKSPLVCVSASNGTDEIRHMMSGALRRSDSAEMTLPTGELLSDREGANGEQSEDIQAVEEDDGESEDSLPSLESILTNSQRIKKRRADTNDDAASHRAKSPLARKLTRSASRRASALANPITLSDDDPPGDNARLEPSLAPFTSTAPATLVSTNTKESAPANLTSVGEIDGRTVTRPDLPAPIDLTAGSSDEGSSSNDDIIDTYTPRKTRKPQSMKYLRKGGAPNRRTMAQGVVGMDAGLQINREAEVRRTRSEI